MVTLFHDMMHKEVEVYVDDMIAKSRTSDQHLNDLQKLFERLQKYKLRLNSAKCTFGVKTGKLLGFIVNERGTKVDQDKVKAIQDMQLLKQRPNETLRGKKSNLLSQQEIHGLRAKIPNTRTNLLCSSLDCEEIETVHAIPHYMAHRQDGPPQIHLRKTSTDRTECMMADGPVGIRHSLCQPQSHQRECHSKVAGPSPLG
ncbi:putative protein K02A2.6, partial [Mucuna pruriens]